VYNIANDTPHSYSQDLADPKQDEITKSGPSDLPDDIENLTISLYTEIIGYKK